LLVALAIGGAWLAIHYGVQWIIALLIGAGGVFMLVSGLRMIGTRKAHVPSGGPIFILASNTMQASRRCSGVCCTR
jgi:uncharacterized membrane protein YqgA involved in biofilm formation